MLIVSPRLPTRPEWCPPDAWQSREISPDYFGRSRYAFQLRANPTKKVINPHKPKALGINGRIDRNKNARRIPLRQPADLRTVRLGKALRGFAVEADSEDCS
jgi:hypothetical protein